MEFLNEHLFIRTSKSTFSLKETDENVENNNSNDLSEAFNSTQIPQGQYEIAEDGSLQLVSDTSEQSSTEVDIETPSSSRSSKRKRTNFEETSVNCLVELSAAAKNIAMKNKHTPINKSQDEIFGSLVAASLSDITNKRHKLEAKAKINQILYEYQLKCIDE